MGRSGQVGLAAGPPNAWGPPRSAENLHVEFSEACIAGRLVTRGGPGAEAHRVRRVGVLRHNAGDAVGEEALAGLQGDSIDKDEPSEAVADLLQQLLHPHASQGVADQVHVVQVIAVDHLQPARASAPVLTECTPYKVSSETGYGCLRPAASTSIGAGLHMMWIMWGEPRD